MVPPFGRQGHGCETFGRPSVYAGEMRQLCKFFAAFVLALAVLVSLNIVTFSRDAVLLPLGLFLWILSELVFPAARG